MMKKFSVIVCLLVFTMVANAEIVVFQDRQANAYYPTLTTDWETSGYQGTHDTDISSYGSSRYYNMGQNQYLRSGAPNMGPMHLGMLKFDLSCLVGQTIVGATLELWSRGAGYPDQEIRFHEMHDINGGWVEGAQAGAPGQPGDPTWNHSEVTGTTGSGEGGREGYAWRDAGKTAIVASGPYGPSNWTYPAYTGMPPYPDYDADTALATVMRTDNASTSYQGFTFDLPASVVQKWVIPDIQDAAGLVLHASYMDIENYDPEVDPWHWPYCSESMVYFLSSDYATGQLTYSLLPKLTVEVIPEPITMILVGVGGLFLRRRK
jgi:hypothetical protein